MKVSIDKTKCVICAGCVAIAPEVFELKEDGTVDVKQEYQGVDIQDEAIKAKVIEARDGCPADAIVVQE